MKSFSRQDRLQSEAGEVSMPKTHKYSLVKANDIYVNFRSFSCQFICSYFDVYSTWDLDNNVIEPEQYICELVVCENSLYLDDVKIEEKDVLDFLMSILRNENYKCENYVYRIMESDYEKFVQSFAFSHRSAVTAFMCFNKSIVLCDNELLVCDKFRSFAISLEFMRSVELDMVSARYSCIKEYMVEDVVLEAGKYSKYHTRKQRKTKKKQKLQKVLEDVESKNLGSKRKHVPKVIRRKMRTEHIEEHAGVSPEKIFEVLEKALGVFLCNYFNKPLYKGLSAILLLFRGSIAVEVYNKVSGLFKTVSGEKCTVSDFVDWLKSLLINVETFKLNKYATMFTKFVTRIFSCFLCPGLSERMQDIFKNNAVVSKILSLFDKDTHPLECILNYVFYVSSAVQVYIEDGVLDGFLDTRTVDDSMFEKMRVLRNDFELFKTGDLEFIKEKKMYKFFGELREVRNAVQSMYTSKVKLDKKQYQQWLAELDNMDREVVVHNKNNALKYQTFCWSMSSGSGISKSHVARVINTSMAIANNILHSDYYTFYLNQNNKFQSGWKNSNTIVVVDDACAMRLDANAEALNLADWLLRGSNNIPHELLGAFQGEKGTLFNRALIESWMANTFDMFFHEQARFPSALHRRFKVKLIAKVRPQYCKVGPDGTVSSQIDYSRIPKDMQGEIAMDAWLFTAYVVNIKDSDIEIKTEYGAKRCPEKDNDVKFVIDMFESKPVEDVDFPTLLRYMIAKSKEHFADQERVLEMSKRSNNSAEYCSHGLPKQYQSLCAHCSEKKPEAKMPVVKIEEHSSSKYRVSCLKSLLDLIQKSRLQNVREWEECNDTIGLLKKILTSGLNALSTWFDKVVLDVFHIIVERVVKRCEHFFKFPHEYVPKCVEATKLGALIHGRRREFILPMIRDYVFYTLDYTIPYWTMSKKQFIEAGYANYKPFHGNVIAKCKELQIEREYDKYEPLTASEFCCSGANAITSEMWEQKDAKEDNVIRDHIIPIAGSLLITTIFIPKLVSGLKKCYIEEQVGVSIPVSEIAKFDALDYKPWYKGRAEVMINPPKTGKSILPSDLKHVVEQDLLIVEGDGEHMSAISISHQLVLIPHHFVKRHINKMVKIKKAPCDDVVSLNMQVEFQLMPDMVYKIPGDACIIYVGKLMDHMKPRDLTPYFPEFHYEHSKAGRLICFADDKLSRIPIKDIQFSDVLNNENVIDGSLAQRPFAGHSYLGACRKGMCGGAVVDETGKHSCIIGIHVGGCEVNGIGVSVSILRHHITDAKAHFSPSRIDFQSAVNMEMYGQDPLVKEVYDKNVFVTSIDRCDGLELIGKVLDRNSPSSKVVNTPIYDAVKKEFNVDFDYGAPDVTFQGDKKHGVRSLAKNIGSKVAFKDCELLKRASVDLSNQVCRPLLIDSNFWKEEIRLLSFDECVNGIDGKKFINCMNMSTKYGSHKPGLKSDHFTQNDNGSYDAPEYTKAEFERRLSLMKEGIITFEFLTQHLKNEATPQRKVDAGKVRNFFMTNTETQMLFRMYTQTLCRYWNLTSDTSECAVGINPHSTQWHTLWSKMEGFSTKYTALDFKNFDLDVPYEVLSVALDILFKPLKFYDKSKETSNVLKCLKHTLMHCMVNVNGDIVIIPGIIPSGINLTSVLGCIVNSLYHRLAVFSLYPEVKNFSDVMFLRTFGDDSMGSVKPGYNKINVKNLISTMRRFNIQATDIHKNVDSNVIYYKKQDIEFLKRSFKYDNAFGANVAPLTKESMFKMLMCHVPTKTISIEALTGQCVDNFLLEAAFHGRKYHESARQKLSKICKSHDLTHHCNNLDVKFEDYVREWKEKAQLSSVGKEYVQFWSTKNWMEWLQL